MASEKITCRDCHWHGRASEMLIAQHPFAPTETISGCPKCKGIDQLFVVCDEPGCAQEVSCGTPTPQGYRQTCGAHQPEWKK